MISVYDEYLGKYITSDKASINEAYFKDLTLQGIDSIFDKIKHKSINGMRHDASLVATLPNLIKTLFGFKRVNIYIEDEKDLTAWTHLREGRKKAKILQSERGIRFEDNGHQPDVDIYFAYGLLSHPYITGAMVTAILLHEIGHNFQNYVLSHPDVSNRNLLGRRSGEMFSDQFAAMYGYGPIGLEATMVRLNQRIRGDNEDVNRRAQEWSTGDNVHPFDFDRLEYVLGQLETDLAHQKNLNSRTRQELEQEIALYRKRMLWHLDQVNSSPYKANFDKFRAADKGNPYRSGAEEIANPQRINDDISNFKYSPHAYTVTDIKSPNSGNTIQSYTQIGSRGQRWNPLLTRELDSGIRIAGFDHIKHSRTDSPKNYKKNVYNPVFPQYVSHDSDKPVSKAIKAQIDDQSGKVHIPRYKSVL